MDEDYAELLDMLKQFQSVNHTTNHRDPERSAQSRALSGIKKMSTKQLMQVTELEIDIKGITSCGL